MKKVIAFLFSMSCIIALTTTSVKAQENAYAYFNFNSIETGTETVVDEPANVNSSAYTDFSKRFSNASDVKWTSTEKYTVVYFKENDVTVRAIYNKKGKLSYTIKFFNAQQVPAAIKSTLIKNGYGMSIRSVVEIESRYASTSFVKLEDKTSITTVQILADGEVSEVEHFRKAR